MRKININDYDALQDLSKKIRTIVPVLKKCSTGLIDPSTVISEKYNFHYVLQGTGAFQKCEVREKHVIDTSLFSIGAPMSNNTIFLDDAGNIQQLTFKKRKKNNNIGVYAMKWGQPDLKREIHIPKYNYNAFDEQCFQLSCTDPDYAIIQFYMELQIAFNSNLYINLLAMNIDEVFKDI